MRACWAATAGYRFRKPASSGILSFHLQHHTPTTVTHHHARLCGMETPCPLGLSNQPVPDFHRAHASSSLHAPELVQRGEALEQLEHVVLGQLHAGRHLEPVQTAVPD